MRKWLIMITTGIAIMLANLDLTIVNLGLPAIGKALHANLAQMQWVMSSYLLAGAMGFLIFGRLADKYGIRTMFLLGEGIFVVSSLIAALSPTIHMLIIARFLQGLGFAATLGLSIVLILKAFPTSQKGLATGVAITITGVSQAIGPTVGGIILSYLSWHWIFIINIPLGLITIIGTLIFTPKDTDQTKSIKIDFLGSVNLAVAIGLLVYSINELASASLLQTVPLLAIGIILLVVFFKRCFSHPHALVDRSILTNKSYLLTLASRILFMFYMMTMLFIIPLYLINIVGLSDMKAGLLMLFMTTLAAITSPITGTLIDKFGYRRPLQLSFIAAALGPVILLATATQLNYAVLIPGLMLYGISVGLHVSSSINAILTVTNIKHHGVVTGLFFTLGMLGGALGISLSGSIVNFISRHSVLAKTHMLTDSVLNQVLNVAKGSSSIHGLAAQYHSVAQNAFMSGNHTVYALLIALMIVALIITLKIKNIKSNAHVAVYE